MSLTPEAIRAELERLRQLREQKWAEVNQIIGAEGQLKLILDMINVPSSVPMPEIETNVVEDSALAT